MKLTNVSLSIMGIVLAISLAVNALGPLIEDLNSDENHKYRSLKPSMTELAEQLEAGLPESSTPEENIAMAESILGGLGPALMGTKKLQKKALKLFVSYKDVVDKCNLEGYKILAGNFLAIPNNKRLRRVSDHYGLKHGQNCRPQYKQKFAKQMEKFAKDDLEKIKLSLAHQGSENFDCPLLRMSKHLEYDVLEMPRPDFIDKCSDKARRQLAYNVVRQVMTTPQWKSSSSEDEFYEEYPKEPASVFDEYVFKPCKKFHELFDDILTPARYDSAIRDSEQREFLKGDKNFYDAIGYNRLCASLLENKSKLYKRLAEAWDEASHQF